MRVSKLLRDCSPHREPMAEVEEAAAVPSAPTIRPAILFDDQIKMGSHWLSPFFDDRFLQMKPEEAAEESHGHKQKATLTREELLHAFRSSMRTRVPGAHGSPERVVIELPRFSELPPLQNAASAGHTPRSRLKPSPREHLPQGVLRPDIAAVVA